MNLADILIPEIANSTFTPAESAESAEPAESEQWPGLRSPQVVAESCEISKDCSPNPHNPQVPADSKTSANSGFPHNPHNPQARMVEIEKPLPVTVEYFRSRGAELLTEDLAFLRWNLPSSTAQMNACIRQYLDIWQVAMEQESLGQKKQNAGRRAANTWLREMLK